MVGLIAYYVPKNGRRRMYSNVNKTLQWQLFKLLLLFLLKCSSRSGCCYILLLLLLILLHIHGCNEQLWSIELQMGMHKKLLAKLLQLLCLSVRLSTKCCKASSEMF